MIGIFPEDCRDFPGSGSYAGRFEEGITEDPVLIARPVEIPDSPLPILHG